MVLPLFLLQTRLMGITGSSKYSSNIPALYSTSYIYYKFSWHVNGDNIFFFEQRAHIRTYFTTWTPEKNKKIINNKKNLVWTECGIFNIPCVWHILFLFVALRLLRNFFLELFNLRTVNDCALTTTMTATGYAKKRIIILLRLCFIITYGNFLLFMAIWNRNFI